MLKYTVMFTDKLRTNKRQMYIFRGNFTTIDGLVYYKAISCKMGMQNLRFLLLCFMRG